MTSNDPLGIVGTTVAGKYRILAVAGDGGFSTVYKAEHLIWEQPVAIKFFDILEEAEPDTREKLLDDFIQEGKVMSELSSRCVAVVQARDIGKLARPNDSWIPFMVLEWIDGTALDVVVQAERRRGLEPRGIGETLRLLDDAAKALDYAHKKGIAHRDLKPANLMILGDARADEITTKLLDFGIAKVMAAAEVGQNALELTGREITSFTPNHGAPEQFSRNYGATGPWTDVYAMALLMVEVMTNGTSALEGETFYELGVSSCSTDRRPTPRTLGVDVSDRVEAIFGKALALDPGDRYDTMGAFFRDLHHEVFPSDDTWRSGMTQKSHPDPPTLVMDAQTGSNLPPVPERRLGRSAGLVLGAGAVAAVAVGATIFAMGSEPPSGPSAAAAVAGTAPTSAATADSTAKAATSPSAAALTAEGCPASMKLVPGGRFTMGSDDTGFPLWKPAHEVTLDTYCLDTKEVTVDAYQACVDGGGCKPADTAPDYPKADNMPQEEHDKQLQAFAELCNAGKSSRGDHPINCVDWYRADAYCKHVGARLPTEAEWELAARGTDGRTYPWGNDDGSEFYMNAAGTEWKAWMASHDLPAPQGLMFEGDDGFAGTAPVGRYPRAQTQRGHLDMVGNVWEWTNDWYALYSDEEQRNPKGPAAGERKAIRGGGFNGEFALWMRPAARYHQLATASVHVIGFRCAADVGQLK